MGWSGIRCLGLDRIEAEEHRLVLGSFFSHSRRVSFGLMKGMMVAVAPNEKSQSWRCYKWWDAIEPMTTTAMSTRMAAKIRTITRASLALENGAIPYTSRV